jgi:hypothetical protein
MKYPNLSLAIQKFRSAGNEPVSLADLATLADIRTSRLKKIIDGQEATAAEQAKLGKVLAVRVHELFLRQPDLLFEGAPASGLTSSDPNPKWPEKGNAAGEKRFLTVAFTIRNVFDKEELPFRRSVVVAASDLSEALGRSGDIFHNSATRSHQPAWTLETLSEERSADECLLNWFARELQPGELNHCVNAESLAMGWTEERLVPEPKDCRSQQKFECVAYVLEDLGHAFDSDRPPIRRSCVLWAHNQDEAYRKSDEVLVGRPAEPLNWFVRPVAVLVGR